MTKKTRKPKTREIVASFNNDLHEVTLWEGPGDVFSQSEYIVYTYGLGTVAASNKEYATYPDDATQAWCIYLSKVRELVYYPGRMEVI